MKRIIGIILLHLLVVAAIQAQEKGICGTPSTPSKWTEDYLSNRGAYAKSDELLYVPLTIHVVGKSDGTGYIRVKNILDALCSLNEDYAPANVQFYISGAIRYINNNALYDVSSTSAGSQIIRNYRVANTVNCFLVGTIGSSDGSTLLGYSNGIPSVEVVLRNSTIGTGDPTWAHELGHSMGLYHTFRGWEGYEHNYTQNAPAFVNNNREVEYVSGDNCATAGDGLCDTAPDYLSGGPWSCNAEGQSNIQQLDPSGMAFRSDGRNFMSYSSNSCQNRFTAEQIQVVRANLTTAKSNFINLLQPLPSLDSQKVTLLLPKQGETVAFSLVTLEWNAVPNASNYLIEVSRLSNFAATFTEVYATTANILQLTTLDNNRTYYWRVKPYNRNSFCAAYSATGNFRAGTPSTTDVEDVIGKASFHVFPNPLSEQQILNIESQLQENTRLQVRLFDLSGKLLQTAAYDVIAGVNKLQFTPGNLPKGVYILNMVADKINVVKRIVIQ